MEKPFWMLSMSKDIRVLPAVTVRAMLDVSQSLQINLFKHIGFKIAVNFLNPFILGFILAYIAIGPIPA